MALPQTVDALGTKITIHAAKDLLSPIQFTACLQKAGFDTALIESTEHLGQYAIPSAQLIRFHQAIAALCGEVTLRLLFSNLGNMAAQQIARVPEVAAIRDRYVGLPLATQAENTIRDIALTMSVHRWLLNGPYPVAGRTHCWHIRVPDCLYCVGIQTRKPICASQISTYRQLTVFACRAPITVAEVECCAAGDGACVLEFQLIS